MYCSYTLKYVQTKYKWCVCCCCLSHILNRALHSVVDDDNKKKTTTISVAFPIYGRQTVTHWMRELCLRKIVLCTQPSPASNIRCSYFIVIVSELQLSQPGSQPLYCFNIYQPNTNTLTQHTMLRNMFRRIAF